jgi:hypothetical protein
VVVSEGLRDQPNGLLHHHFRRVEVGNPVGNLLQHGQPGDLPLQAMERLHPLGDVQDGAQDGGAPVVLYLAGQDFAVEGGAVFPQCFQQIPDALRLLPQASLDVLHHHRPVVRVDKFVHPHPVHHLVLPVAQHPAEGRVDVADPAVLEDVDAGQIGLGERPIAGLEGTGLVQETALKAVVLPQERAHGRQAQEQHRPGGEPVHRKKGVVGPDQPRSQPAPGGGEGEEAVFQPAQGGGGQGRAGAQEEPGQDGEDKQVDPTVAHQATSRQGDGRGGIADSGEAPGPQRERQTAQEGQQEDHSVKDAVGENCRPLAGVQGGLPDEKRDHGGSGPAHCDQEHVQHTLAPGINRKVGIAHAGFPVHSVGG